jgi:hypothetical protein
MEERKEPYFRIREKEMASHVLLLETAIARARERVSSFKMQMGGSHDVPMEKPSSLFMLLGQFLMIHFIHEYFLVRILLSCSSV